MHQRFAHDEPEQQTAWIRVGHGDDVPGDAVLLEGLARLPSALVGWRVPFGGRKTGREVGAVYAATY